ncbi:MULTISPECIES: hypothetical protein [unclassified Paenibacillus]|uniref:hypothetical protein n=1 Tax=unclassified Paenibacillus TaxID=185978 RepID=UPI0027818FFE|nr:MULTISPECIES: hypothetical protein [unclassified Paenibacillus]MDQ0896404.1 radical SAM superfamily enzyme [Paenibacillus sp. V4I7]MDQ0914052.1 radical SAM superfamily enzyme [Paenibacillus sp. V4I5]
MGTMVINEMFWAGIKSDALNSEYVKRFEMEQILLHAIAYRPGAIVKDVLDVLKSMDVQKLKNLYEELYHYVAADYGSEDFDQENSHQTIMEINRTVGISDMIRALPIDRRRRLL